jgi:ATP-binding protein involved in chromosome partitioning
LSAFFVPENIDLWKIGSSMKSIVAVASGKGGVGKSTLAANLAVALANRKDPLKVALIDCDFYGPSIPTLMGGGEMSVDAEEKFIPAKRHGVKYISIAFFLQNPDDPIVWRGPMFGKAIQQLFHDTNWGEVDICLVDMPPGTGDAQLSLSQMVNLDGALMVTTPQEVALADVRRAVNMFGKVNVDVLGVVENMAGFKAPDGSVVDLFGAGGGQALCDKFGLPLFGSVPIDLKVREGGDSGEPAALDADTEAGAVFHQLADKLLEAIANAKSQQTEIKVVN